MLFTLGGVNQKGRLLLCGGWVLGGLGCLGVPLAFALLAAGLLSDRAYLEFAAGSLAIYAGGLWAAERGARLTACSELALPNSGSKLALSNSANASPASPTRPKRP